VIANVALKVDRLELPAFKTRGLIYITHNAQGFLKPPLKILGS